MSAGLAGFAQGLARSPLGNLPQLLIQKEQLGLAREERAGRKKAGELAAAGDYEGARGAYMALGDLASVKAVDELWRRNQEEEVYGLASAMGPEPAIAYSEEIGRGDLARAIEDREYLKSSRGVSLEQAGATVDATRAGIDATRAGTAATTGAEERAAGRYDAMKSADALGLEAAELTNQKTREAMASEKEATAAYNMLAVWKDGDWAGLEQNLSNFVNQHGVAMQKGLNLPAHRMPVGVEIQEDGTDDPLVAITIHNTQSRSTGPETRRGSPDRDDQVVTYRLSQVKSWLAAAAGVKPTSEEWGSLGGGRGTFSKATGAMNLAAGTGKTTITGDRAVLPDGSIIELDPTKLQVSKQVTDMIDKKVSAPGALSVDLDISTIKGLATRVAGFARQMGHTRLEDMEQIIGDVVRILGQPNEISEAVLGGEGGKEVQDRGVGMLLLELGLIQPPSPQDAGLADVAATAGGDTNPGATMPQRGESGPRAPTGAAGRRASRQNPTQWRPERGPGTPRDRRARRQAGGLADVNP